MCLRKLMRSEEDNAAVEVTKGRSDVRTCRMFTGTPTVEGIEYNNLHCSMGVMEANSESSIVHVS